MDLVVGHRQFAPLEPDLDQLSGLTRPARLGANPLRAYGVVRPDHDNRVSGVQLFLDRVREGAMGKQLIVNPYLVAGAPQGFRY